MNRVIKFLMISDILVLTSFGLIEPILAIFFKDDLVGGTILMAGLASTIFLLVKCFIQLPFSKYVDSYNYKTRLRWLIFGSFLISTVPFIYIFAKHIYVVFFAQVIYGVGSGLSYPAWLGLWSTHLDKKKESFEWSLYSTLTGLGTAVAAAIGAALSQFVGFTFTFIFVGVLSLIGCLVLFELDRRKNKLEILFKTNYHKKRKLIKGRNTI
ncbi:MAG: MFS transporter [Nanoarchaeota archaeon]|nr:MFS transporter [Nanoarchaeota archaeon]MBU1632256.1 MFS transporter [Nanoarchaeota archaeon]MBU1876063.1 MFS transporter [Nanoarchaeota archaeon]